MSARKLILIAFTGILAAGLLVAFSSASVVKAPETEATSAGCSSSGSVGSCSAAGCTAHSTASTVSTAGNGPASCSAGTALAGCSAAAAVIDGCSPAGAASRCSDYGACSLRGDLSAASDETLEMYRREKATDGVRFDDEALPEFEAVSLDGQVVNSADLVGKPTLLVFMAAHCGHCFKSLPILQQVQEEYAGEDLQVVGVYVNSGSAARVRDLTAPYRPDFTQWSHPDPEIGESIDSHLVPTYLLVDANGQVKQKLVGFKSKGEVQESLENSLEMRAPRVEIGLAQ